MNFQVEIIKKKMKTVMKQKKEKDIIKENHILEMVQEIEEEEQIQRIHHFQIIFLIIFLMPHFSHLV